jgi:long-chain acyl-CoA synthetase
MLVHDFFTDTVARLPTKTALICDGVRYSYADLAARANTLAHTLHASGIKRHDRVALFLDNSVEMVVGIYATLAIGAIFIPINGLTKPEKLNYLLNDSTAAALITDAALEREWQNALAENKSVIVAVVVNAEAATSSASIAARVIPYPTDLTSAAFERDTNANTNTIDCDLASIIYTSGSTGEPKGVMMTHLNMISAMRSVIQYLELTESDVIVCVLPLAFGYGLYQLVMSIALGATLVLERSFAFPMKVVATIAKEKVTVFAGVPTIFSALINLKTLDQFDLSALKKITNAAAALSVAHLQQLRALFPHAAIYSMYGLTECKRVTFLPPDQLDIRPSSVGRGMPNQELWLADDAGNRLPNGSTGELVIRGSHVMRGYWGKPDETRQRLRPGPHPGELVLYSGDLFRTDAEGWLYFVSRRDDVIKSRGEKVSPIEVENAIYALEGVLEVAVIGIADDLLGQAVKAFVVQKPGFNLVERDVIRHCLARLENFMAPKVVAFVDTLPKTESGKIKKLGLC